ncbi:uncharacterized protein PgNI_09754 [Pyricularia grisea]|uniref:Replication factor C subunit 1 n=1 Tax=Pyricularia grisea TaxID=148305 RepID=A0A6P8ATJ6_PYRGI|nr:uncharacterized protein PgNI_09754 [Pyricularia grisea]TLD05456.1 hypothetical protein PgNI_09754 [Pyricularia grisea]
MPADIRSFFGGKGGAAPAKPAASKKENEPVKKATKARSTRIVLDDSDDEPAQPPKATAKATPKKKASADAPKGTAITASDYFANSGAGDKKPQATPKATSKFKTEVEVRISPRTRAKADAQPSSASAKTTTKPAPSPAPKATAKTTAKATKPKKPVTSYKKYDSDDDDDAFVDDDDDEDDDIFAADVKGRSKRKNDEYVEEDSDDDILPQPKRVASRGRPKRGAVKEESSDEEEVSKPSKSAATGRKRKSPPTDPEVSEDEDQKPRKKPAAKPRATKPKVAPTEDPGIQAILDNVPTVRPPTPPPKDPNAKFDWRKAQAGGGNSGAPPAAGSIELPEGQEDCLSGLTFVFTGLLKTIGREEAQALVKRYGGKVTGAPSGKTSFVVLGDDAGPSKLAKIKQHGLKTIDEVGLFHLISTLPAHGGSGLGAEKAREKREAEAEKVKQAAEEMEAEEKAKRMAAEKARKAAGAKGASAPPAPPPPNSQLWTTKYAPTALNHICGNKAQVEKIKSWLENWPKSRKYDFKKRGADGLGGERAIIVSGPPGIGKTTAAHMAAKLAGYDVLESNASDTRSKKLVENGVSDVINNTSLLGYFSGDGKKVDQARKNIVLIMDEVDGMSAGDRGGVGALAKFCKKTEVPLILICNERRLPKMKPFDHVAFDIRFNRPTVDQIRSRIMTICHREGLGKMPPQVIDALIEGCNKDIRQIINMVHSIKLDGASLDYTQTKTMTKAWEKHVILKPWDICQKMLAGGLFSPASKATLNDKIELYFNDHEFSYLMIQENYLGTKPMALSGKGYNKKEENLKYLELVEKASESISDGDLVDRMIHGPQQQWSLMPTHAVFSSVRPASYIAGQLMGANFTSWLGNNSKTGKLGRFVREIHSHMRLKSSGDHNEVRQQYLPVLWNQMIQRLGVDGKDAIDGVIELMDSYYLTRDDFDAIKELGVGPQDESKVNIETQTKAAFTRTYNSMSHPIPFMKASNVQAPKAAAKEMPDLEEAIEEEDDAAVVADPAADEDEEELDLKKDKYIKQPKAKPAKKAAPAKKKTGASKKAANAEDDFIDDDDEPKPAAKGRGRPAKAGKAKK